MDIHNCYTIDFETTDVDPKKCEPLEFACVSSSGEFNFYIRPDNAIPAETSAVHHIMDSDIATAPSWAHQKKYLCDFFTASPGSTLPILVAHNAEYERTILGEFPPVLWVCTYKCALRVWPEAPSHKNEVLRYWLQLGTNRGRNSDQRPHSALHDAQVTFLLLQKLLEHATLQQLIEWTEQPKAFPKITFGMHRGKKWDEIPDGYLTWMLKQTDMDPDVLHCAKQEIQRRRTSAAKGPY